MAFLLKFSIHHSHLVGFVGLGPYIRSNPGPPLITAMFFLPGADDRFTRFHFFLDFNKNTLRSAIAT